MKTIKQKPKKTSFKKPLLIGAGVIAILALAYGGYRLYTHFTGAPHSLAQPAPDAPKVNYDPPSETEKQETEQHKSDITKDDNPAPAPSPTPGTTVTPVIVSAYYAKSSQTLEVRAFIQGIIEGGGTCTLNVISGSATVLTKDSAGIANASTTDCTPFSISPYTLPAEAKVTVSYKSAAAAGQSAERNVDQTQ